MTDKQRKKRVAITLEILRNIRRYLDMEKSVKDISALTEVSYSSVLKICNKIVQGLQDNDIIKSKKGIQTIDENPMKTRLAAIVNQDNSLTQIGMAETLELYGFRRSQGTISRALKKMNITRKRLTKVPLERNSAKK